MRKAVRSSESSGSLRAGAFRRRAAALKFRTECVQPDEQRTLRETASRFTLHASRDRFALRETASRFALRASRDRFALRPSSSRPPALPATSAAGLGTALRPARRGRLCSARSQCSAHGVAVGDGQRLSSSPFLRSRDRRHSHGAGVRRAKGAIRKLDREGPRVLRRRACFGVTRFREEQCERQPRGRRPRFPVVLPARRRHQDIRRWRRERLRHDGEDRREASGACSAPTPTTSVRRKLSPSVTAIRHRRGPSAKQNRSACHPRRDERSRRLV
ncbi:hypothetical protein BH09MYX1_BH09MYX1_30220 [soil metagenome]